MARVLILLLGLLLAPALALAQLGTRPPTVINAQTGTSYTVLNSDNGKKVTFSNGSAVAVTLPQAGSNGNFRAGWEATFVNQGAGLATITPATSTIDGLSSGFVLQQYQGVTITSNGTHYFSSGRAPALSASGIIDQDQIPTATVSVKGGVKPGTCLEMSGTTMNTKIACRTGGWDVVIDASGSVLTTGIKTDIEVKAPCTITAVRLLADQTGSIVLDLWKDVYASFPPTGADTITASAKPTLSSAAKSEDTTLTGWTTSLAAGDIIRVNVDSVATITQLTLSITCVQS